MKKFMLMHFGFEEPTPEIMKAWGAWFESIADKQVDLAPVLLEMIVWGARYEETDAPAAVIREMESRRDDFLLRVRNQWEEDRRRCQGSGHRGRPGKHPKKENP